MLKRQVPKPKMKYLIIFLVILIAGCKKNTENIKQQEISYRVFAYEYDHANPKDICLDKEQLVYKNKSFLNANQKYFKVTKKEMLVARKILIDLIDKCNNGKSSKCNPPTIDYYYRQYFGYQENGIDYVYINLCAFYNETYIANTELLVSDNYIFSILTTPERGYAGYVIIDINRQLVSNFHFEKYPQSQDGI